MNKLDLNVEIISQGIMEAAVEIEKAIGQKIMFGAVGGSYSMGLQNGSSDIDCYLAVDNEKLFDVIHRKINVTIQRKQMTIDFMCISYQEIFREIERYGKKQKQYPTVLYRTEEEKKKNIGKKDIERPDFKRSVLFRILLSDKIINKGIVEAKKEEIVNGLGIIDIIDYHYTRVYGNYREVIENRKYIPLRKYLYVIHEICTCKCLMHSPAKPPMDYVVLVKNTISDTSLRKIANDLYEKNRYATRDKKEELIYKNETVNQFIVELMDEICDYLKNNASDSSHICF